MRLLRAMFVLSFVMILAARGPDVRYAAGKSATSIPFEMSNKLIGLAVKINDREGMRVVLDSGAGGSVLDAKTVESLGIKTFGESHSYGSGGAETGERVRGVDVELPGVKLLDQHMTTLSLTPIAAQGGRPMDGILGFPILDRCVVEIDYADKKLNFFDPAGYTYKGNGTSVPLTFKDNLPYVTATAVLPGGRSIQGQFLIDTGASSNLILSAETVEKESVLSDLGKTITVPARGVGGAKDVRLARIAKIDVGGISIDQPVAAIESVGAGRISAPGTVGNIGGGTLSRFKLILDYPHKRLILEPGPEFGKPFETDMSGLSVRSEAPEFRRITVVRILDGSPADTAGIQVGDEIESVDGTPASEIRLSDLRDRLREDGKLIKLALLRSGQAVTAEIRTKRMI